jgi:ABC-type polysaccharide/polyol phosphate export permease
MSSSPEKDGWSENRPDGQSNGSLLGQLWHARELIWFFALRDLRVRYKQTALGVAWVLVQPVMTIAVFTLVFDKLTDVASEGLPYPLFALVGLITWNYLSSVVSRGSEILVNDPALVTKVHFPRLAAPMSALLPPLVDLAVSLILLAVLYAAYGVTPSWRLLGTPLWLLMLAVTAGGVGLWLSALNVRYRDVRHAVTPVLQIWLFASPVAYSASVLTGFAGLAYALNPMSGVVALARWSLLGTPWPGWRLGASVAVTLLAAGTGARYFTRAERTFADVI